VGVLALTLGRLRQEHCEFEASLGYIMRPMGIKLLLGKGSRNSLGHRQSIQAFILSLLPDFLYMARNSLSLKILEYKTWGD
jgi:hypothetical protein